MELIDKAALVAEIESLRKIQPTDEFQPKEQNKIDWFAGKEFAIIALQVFLDTLEVKEMGADFADSKGGKSAKCIIDTKTLDVKEVNLDFQRFVKEMDIVFALPSSETKNTEEEPLNWEYAIAKHFFELGLKAQKGE